MTTRDYAENVVIDHLRGHSHNSLECAICRAEQRAHTAERALDRLIAG